MKNTIQNLNETEVKELVEREFKTVVTVTSDGDRMKIRSADVNGRYVIESGRLWVTDDRKTIGQKFKIDGNEWVEVDERMNPIN